MTRASIIVVSWNGADQLPGCIQALVSEMGDDDELLVVDNASADGSADVIRSAFPDVALIANRANLGFAGGANVGIRAATGAYLFLVNQDVVVRGGWLAAVLAALEPVDVGIVGSKLLYPDGRIQHAGGAVHYPLALPDHFGYHEPDRGQCDRLLDVDFVTGAAIGISRAVVDSVGLFDEGFHPAYYEETDLCARARDAGLRVLYAPEAVAVHRETTSVSREGVEYHRWMARGRLRYVLKHYSATQFHRDFLPAERLWGASLATLEMREGLRMAYLDTLLSLRSIPRTGVLAESPERDRAAVELADLRAALSRLSIDDCRSGEPASGCVSVDRPATAPGTAKAGVNRGLVGSLRNLRERIEHKWYVRCLRLRKELALVEETVIALDRETAEAYRTFGQAVHGLREAQRRIEHRLDDLEAGSDDASPTDPP